jgi:hypothetical protein
VFGPENCSTIFRRASSRTHTFHIFARCQTNIGFGADQ